MTKNNLESENSKIVFSSLHNLKKELKNGDISAMFIDEYGLVSPGNIMEINGEDIYFRTGIDTKKVFKHSFDKFKNVNFKGPWFNYEIGQKIRLSVSEDDSKLCAGEIAYFRENGKIVVYKYLNGIKYEKVVCEDDIVQVNKAFELLMVLHDKINTLLRLD